MEYNTYEPGEALENFVKCFWTLEAPANNSPERQRIVPDGCMEMIFHYGDRYKQYIAEDEVIVQPHCFVFGQITNNLDIEPTGRTGIFAVRFHPNGFMPFASLPIGQMENRAVPLDELFGQVGLALGVKVLAADNTEERIALVSGFLLQRLTLPQTIDGIAQKSVAAMLALNGQVNVEALSEQLSINRRQLERRFAAVIGLSPKQLAKIIRLQAALKMLDKKQFSSLTELAYESGYFDQTHFIKDFKDFAGVSPSQFYAGNLKMTALFAGSN